MSSIYKDLTLLPYNTDFPDTKEEDTFKIYKEGNHFVGTRVLSKKHQSRKEQEKSKEEIFFDEQYVQELKKGTHPRKMFSPMKEIMTNEYPELEDTDEFVNKNIKRNRHNFFSRIKRLRRKADMNIWNKWVTITYDDNLHTEETFRKKLKKCLSNLHTRRQWKYMGVFENAPETGRLHFHALMYIPKDQMPGIIEEKRDYSTKTHQMQITHSNSFFAETFGRNDFEDICEEEIKNGDALEYLTKYISKTNERIIYSRGIPSAIVRIVRKSEIVATMEDFVTKYVFFDDVEFVEPKPIIIKQLTMFSENNLVFAT